MISTVQVQAWKDCKIVAWTVSYGNTLTPAFEVFWLMGMQC